MQQLHLLPENVSFAQGAALTIPYATAYRALVQSGKAKASDIVFIHGATGGVGIASVQFGRWCCVALWCCVLWCGVVLTLVNIARALGLTVLGTGGTEKGRELVLKEGAHHGTS